MAKIMVGDSHRIVAVEALTPDSQLSTNSYVVLTGSEIDVRPWKSLSYTILVATNDITWEVYGANRLDYSDEVIVQAGASVAAGAGSSYAVAQAPYSYYRVKIKSTAGGSHGTAGLYGIAKG